MTASRPEPDRCFDLTFAVDRGGRTFLGAQFVRYPVHVCRGLHVDEQLPRSCAVTLQSVSGGLFESDVVAGRITARAGVQASVNTSASTIVHAMNQAQAQQLVELDVEAGAALRYLPEPLILFPTSRLQSMTRLQVAPGASVLFCESFLAHDPQAKGGPSRPFASLETRVDVVGSDGRLLVRDRMCLRGETWQGAHVGVSDRYPVHGSLWLIRPGADDPALLAAVRGVLDDGDGAAYAGASRLPNQAGLQVRMLCRDAVALRAVLQGVLAQVALHCIPADDQVPCSPSQVPGASPASV